MRPWGLGLACAAGTAAWLFWLQAQPIRWDRDPQATCMPSSCFCEAVRDAAIRQPSDTWSCLGYVFFGGLIVGGLGKNRALAAAFGALSFFLGLTSAYFHAALTFRAEWLDVLCLYLIPGYLLVFNLHRARFLGGKGSWAALAGLAAATGLFLRFSDALRLPVFIGLIVLYLLSERKGPARRRWFWRAVATFAVSFGIWLLDRTHILCSPYSLWQGHAVWHLLCALVIWFLYLYCEENPPPDH